jgi:hypothetical protein
MALRDGHAHLLRPVIGREGETEAQVVSGLSEDDEVVAYPTEEVRDGVRVTKRE